MFNYIGNFFPSESFFNWLNFFLIIFNVAILLLNISLRFWDDSKTSEPNSSQGHKLMALMGSGGHTTEMIKLLSSVLGNGNTLFPIRIYVLTNTDILSREKLIEFENEISGKEESGKFTMKTIPRAREVGQSYASSIWTTLIAAWHSFQLVWTESHYYRPDVVLSNGPAIGFPICLFARCLQLLPIYQNKIVFVESICRVHTLSLTGRLLYHLRIPNAFLVQWPSLQQKYPRTEYIGRLV